MPAKKKIAKKKTAKKTAPKKKTAKKSAKKTAKTKPAARKATKKAIPKPAAKKPAARKPVTKAAAAAPKEAAASTRRAPLVGAPAPAFSLPGDDGAVHTLAEHAGTPVVLYFYPKDDTPGCTIEACDFRDNLARAAAKGAVVYGVSKDSMSSHTRFREKYSLNFPLLSDPELAVHKAYGAWGEKLMYGKPTVGVIRSTFLIGRDGKVAAAWPKVRVDGHVDEVLRALEAL